ncbi:hypothetical protein NW754_012990 [Fusarium falciforme]|nr:hypothetical protein NW754_012990 [Fusarium falciforme]
MSSNTITPETTIVLVTGANQGIGLEVVKKLTAEHPDYHVILSGRRPDAVQEAASSFQAQGLRVSPSSSTSPQTRASLLQPSPSKTPTAVLMFSSTTAPFRASA